MGLFSLETKQVSAALALKAGDAEGSVQAAFSVFDVVDSQGDVVLKSAFTPGQTVPMVWSHDWTTIVGKGIVRVRDDAAVFDGSFFLTTTAGRDAYETVKAMGADQEWSFGFQVLDAEPGVKDGLDVRFLKKLDVFEASPVLVGANRATRTLAIKGHGLSFDEHSDQLQVALAEYLERVRSGAETRGQEKVGRPISEARRGRMTTVSQQVRAAADEIDTMLEETQPKSAGSAVQAPDAELQQQLEQFRHFQARFGLVRTVGVT